jgi:hypothetical protein
VTPESDDAVRVAVDLTQRAPLGAVPLGAVTRRLAYAAQCPMMVVPRTRDAALAVSLIGGMEAAIDA